MRKLLVLSCLFTALGLSAQDMSVITVKSVEVSNGVVILTVSQATPTQGKSSFDLQCNKGASGCQALEPGNYVMVRLPKNYGMYDCANVDVYANKAHPETERRLGEYCLIEK